MAWSWWSFSLPKWRLWAIQRVTDILSLYDSAVKVGLMWPRGHFLEKTEFKSLPHMIQEQEIEMSYFLVNRDIYFVNLPTELDQVFLDLQMKLEGSSDFHDKKIVSQNLKELLILSPNTTDDENKQMYDFLIFSLKDYIELLERNSTRF